MERAPRRNLKKKKKKVLLEIAKQNHSQSNIPYPDNWSNQQSISLVFLGITSGLLA